MKAVAKLSKDVTNFLINRTLHRGSFKLHLHLRDFLICCLILMAIKKYDELKEKEHYAPNGEDLVIICQTLYLDIMNKYPKLFKNNAELRRLSHGYIALSAMKMNGIFVNISNKKVRTSNTFLMYTLTPAGEQAAIILNGNIDIINLIVEDEE